MICTARKRSCRYVKATSVSGQEGRSGFSSGSRLSRLIRRLDLRGGGRRWGRLQEGEISGKWKVESGKCYHGKFFLIRSSPARSPSRRRDTSAASERSDLNSFSSRYSASRA